MQGPSARDLITWIHIVLSVTDLLLDYEDDYYYSLLAFDHVDWIWRYSDVGSYGSF